MKMSSGYKNKDLPVPERIEDLLGRMTLEEKIAQTCMFRGVDIASKLHPASCCTIDDNAEIDIGALREMFGENSVGFIHDVYCLPKFTNEIQRYAINDTRLGIPFIFTGEAIHGFNRPDCTLFPNPLALASTFNQELVKQVAEAIASETRSYGITEITGPNFDLARDPRWGRVEETYGEDVYLTSTMAYQVVKGMQGDDVSAPDKIVTEPKHYCAHGFPEGGINCAPARAGVREVETQYLPPFEAAVVKAGAYNIMASYNSIDGELVISSKHYLSDILRDRYQMRGFVRSDFGAIARAHTMHMTADSHKTAILQALRAGLCVLGFDYPIPFWKATIMRLIETRSLDTAVLDEAVRRILRVKFDLGLFERPYVDETRYKMVTRCPNHLNLAHEAARQAVCLVKNDGIAPLNEGIHTLAVLGPASRVQYEGGYSPTPYDFIPKSVYESFKELLPGAVIRQNDGCSFDGENRKIIPRSWFPQGVDVRFYADSDFSKPAVAADRYEYVNFMWLYTKPNSNLNMRDYGAVFEGYFVVNTFDFCTEEVIEGEINLNAADTYRLYIDNQLLVDNTVKGKRVNNAPFVFVDGSKHHFRIEFVCDAGAINVNLNLVIKQDGYDKAVEYALASDAVVLVCGDNRNTSGECVDRNELILPGQQRDFIRTICELGKPTILIVNNGRPVDLSYEFGVCNAIFINWFNGFYGGQAVVEAVLGEYSPSGRLPISFPRSVGHIPSYYSRLPGRSADEYCGNVFADNLFSFGFGLSYSKFEYSNLEIYNRSADGLCNVEVGISVKNTGIIASYEVVQLYVNDVYSSVVTPLKQLQGYQKVFLLPGEEKRLMFRLDFDSFKLLDIHMQWVVESGEFMITVGPSSDRILLEGIITLDSFIAPETA